MGFSVTGRVLNSLDGEGVPDATVSLNNLIKGELRVLRTLVVMSKICNQCVLLFIYFNIIAYFAILSSQSSARRTALTVWRT